MICKGYYEANNKFLISCDVNKPTSCIIYLDANNFYGHPIMQLLQTEMLGWVNQKILISIITIAIDCTIYIMIIYIMIMQ